LKRQKRSLFARKVDDELERRGIHRKDLAILLEISESMLSQLLSGTKRTPVHINKIYEILEIKR
jgi:transcriptional regulator with XRE-family HTH domain